MTPPLPPGLTLVSSVSFVDMGVGRGCAILCSGSDVWYSTDYYSGPLVPPMSGAASFGPHTTEHAARIEMESTELQWLDASGTLGTSDWLVYP